MDYLTLNNGVKIPKLGFGVWEMFDEEECQESIENALEVGYHLIDTASIYGNEVPVGLGIKASNIKREDIFVTSKAWINQLGYKETKNAFEESLQKLGLEYLDLYLIHQPFGDLYGAWRAMEELYKEGKVRAIGVSNFSTGHLTDFALHQEIVPVLNQIELHPYKQQVLTQKANEEFGIATQAWSPVNRGKENIFKYSILTSIARKYEKSVAQVILRWQVQNDILTIPKSSHLKRMQENFDIFNFSLDEEDLLLIKSLDRHPDTYGPDEDVDHVKGLIERIV